MIPCTPIAAAGPDDVIHDTCDININLESGNNESVPIADTVGRPGPDRGSPTEVAAGAETNAGACVKLSYTTVLHCVVVLMLTVAVALAVLCEYEFWNEIWLSKCGT
ncbi:hypothetical protein AALO_G00299650 [Alosa alosa]|uniref:Uncharacterized protein n=1 Tax=Alosa alosa TaxID=278164 RepID=A0AAV6FF09_9TELE|nr:hypothetical protein AALO_G00299650 [Alosa alosa]